MSAFERDANVAPKEFSTPLGKEQLDDITD
jgi:hypothetical protein